MPKLVGLVCLQLCYFQTQSTYLDLVLHIQINKYRCIHSTCHWGCTKFGVAQQSVICTLIMGYILHVIMSCIISYVGINNNGTYIS